MVTIPLEKIPKPPEMPPIEEAAEEYSKRAEELKRQGLSVQEAGEQAAREQAAKYATAPVRVPPKFYPGYLPPSPYSGLTPPPPAPPVEPIPKPPTVTPTPEPPTVTIDMSKIPIPEPEPRVENILFPSGEIKEGVWTPRGPMTVAQWQREENIRRYMGYTPEEREAARVAAEEAARIAEEKREELGLGLFGEPPESLITAEGEFKEVTESQILKDLKDFEERMVGGVAEQRYKEVAESPVLASLKDLEDRMVTELMTGGGWGGIYAERPEAARESVEMIMGGKTPPQGISPKLLEEYNKFIKEEYGPWFKGEYTPAEQQYRKEIESFNKFITEEYEPWRKEEYEPAAEAYGKEIMAYYGLEGKYTPEKMVEAQRKIEELKQVQEEAGREYGRYTHMMGVGLPVLGETEKQTLERMRGEMEWYSGVVGERREMAGMVRPEMMEARYLGGAQRTLAETEKEMGRITGALEPLEAYYYQRYGRPLTSELLAEAPGRLRPSPVEVFRAFGPEPIFDIGLPKGPSPREVTQIMALGGAQVVGIGEEALKFGAWLTGQTEALGPEMKYRAPVTPLTVWGHPAAEWAGLEIKIPSAVLAAVAGYGLEMKAITAGAKAVLVPPVKTVIGAVKAPIEAAKLEYVAYKVGWTKELGPAARAMGWLYGEAAPPRVMRAIEWGRRIPGFGRAFRWHPEVELAQADIAKWTLRGQKFGETLGFKPLRVRMGLVEYMRMQELMKTFRAPTLAYLTEPARAEFYFAAGRGWRLATIGKITPPELVGRPAPEVLAILSGQKAWRGGVGAWRTFVVQQEKTLAKFLAPSAEYDTITAAWKLAGRATMRTQMIFEPMRAPFVTAREIFGTGIRRAPATLRAIEAGKPFVMRMRPMPSIDISWEFITRPGRYAPTFTAAERAVIPLKMITKPGPETFKLLVHYEEVDRTLAAWAAGAGKQPSMSKWAKSFMRTFQTRASPAQVLEPMKVVEKQVRITAFEFKLIKGVPTPSVFEGIASSLAKITGAGATAALAIRGTIEEREKLEQRFGLEPLERVMIGPEYKAAPIVTPVVTPVVAPVVTPIVTPIQTASAAVEERIKQMLKLETRQMEMVGVPAEVTAPPAYPRPFVFPFAKVKKKRPSRRPLSRKLREEERLRIWELGKIERMFKPIKFKMPKFEEPKPVPVRARKPRGGGPKSTMIAEMDRLALAFANPKRGRRRR